MANLEKTSDAAVDLRLGLAIGGRQRQDGFGSWSQGSGRNGGGLGEGGGGGPMCFGTRRGFGDVDEGGGRGRAVKDAELALARGAEDAGALHRHSCRIRVRVLEEDEERF